MMSRPWHLAETNYGAVKASPAFEVAMLPLGATEPHNLHLPYGTDTFQVEVVASRACARATDKGARVVMLPPLPYGTETNQMRFPLAMNLNPSTVAKIIADLVRSLEIHGIRKCVLLNGHGGNDLKWVLRELHLETTVQIFLCNWYKMAADHYPKLYRDAGDHAGEMETSMILAHRPDLVTMDQADAGGMARRSPVPGTCSPRTPAQAIRDPPGPSKARHSRRSSSIDSPHSSSNSPPARSMSRSPSNRHNPPT
jgi:creatinine amidohydrolase